MPSERIVCPKCGGKGEVAVAMKLGRALRVRCTACRGAGTVDADEYERRHS